MGVTLAELLRCCREARGFSQRALSLRSGLSDSVVGKIEARSIEPSLRAFARVVTELGLNAHEVALLVALAARRDAPGASSSPSDSGRPSR